MSHFSELSILYVFSGLGIGFLVGMTGVGGGSLMTPILILLFKVHPQAAVGTDLLYAAITKSVGTLVHGYRGSVVWPIVGRLLLGSLPAAIVTLLVLAYVGGETRDTSELIKKSLGFALLITAVGVYFKSILQKLVLRHAAESLQRNVHFLTVFLGSLLGVAVTLSSVGAGTLTMSLLVLLYPTLGITRLIGSDIAHAVPLTFVAGLGHWWMGEVDTIMLFSLLLGSIPGIVLGSLCVGLVPERVQRTVLATVLVAVGWHLI